MEPRCHGPYDILRDIVIKKANVVTFWLLSIIEYYFLPLETFFTFSFIPLWSLFLISTLYFPFLLLYIYLSPPPRTNSTSYKHFLQAFPTSGEI